MQRAMMTTIEMFKNHPNKEKIRFVVIPVVREVLHTINDMCMDVNEMIKKYGHGSKAAQGLKFDFSALFTFGVPELW